MSKQTQKTNLCTCSELVVFMYWTGKSMNNLLSYCGLIDAKISASEKDLPVPCRKIKQRKFREKFRRIRNRENM